MKRSTIGFCAALIGVAGIANVAPAAAVPDDLKVPDGFQVRLVATGLDQPTGLDILQQRGPVTHPAIFVTEAGTNKVVEVNLANGDCVDFAYTMGSFPVGIKCREEPGGMGMYIGNSMGYGIVKIDQTGGVQPFALKDKNIAGLDFGEGPFGSALYAGEWQSGKIWKVADTFVDLGSAGEDNTDNHGKYGNAKVFVELEGCQTRHMEFAPSGGLFGDYLYCTDAVEGNVYRVSPGGIVKLFASVGSTQLEGMAFGFGTEFGAYLYVGDLDTGEIFRIDEHGNVALWAKGFAGVADIMFRWVGTEVRMYVVDGQGAAGPPTEARPMMFGSVYEIAPE